jgi:hypothetical protein
MNFYGLLKEKLILNILVIMGLEFGMNGLIKMEI